MRVQLVNMASYKPVFRNNSSCDDSRPATVSDIRDMEDRIIKHMDANFEKQNEMIGAALYYLSDLGYFKHGNSLKNAQKSAQTLMNNGQPVENHTYHFSEEEDDEY